MNWSTSASNGSIPSLGAQRSKSLARAGVPAGEIAERSLRRSYSCSTFRRSPGRAGSVACLRALAWIEGFSSAAHDEVAGVEQLAFPAAVVEVEDRPGLLCEVRVAREDPGAVVPRRIASSDSQRHTVTPEICSTIPRATASRASSEEDHREAARPSRRAARTPTRSPQRAPVGGKAGGLPRRGRSSRPAKRCSKNRFRHCDTTSRPQAQPGGSRSLRSPSAGNDGSELAPL